MRTVSLLLFLLVGASTSSCKPDTTIAAGKLSISQEANDLILYYEVGGRGYYEAKLKQPTVPPGFSGVTWGIGYDGGYNTPAQIRADWGGVLTAAQVTRLVSVSGKTGATARAILPRVRDIVIPWEAAVQVYQKRTMPRFGDLTAKTYGGVTELSPHIQGVMLSMTFNRGSSLSRSSRRKEMRWTRDDIAIRKITKLPSYQLQMRRLWPNIRGLLRRYTAHAGLLQRVVDESQ